MKVLYILPFCFGPLSAYSENMASPEKITERDSPTENELKIERKQAQTNPSGTTYTPPASTLVIAGSDPQNFVKNSDILCFRDSMILIPKHSILLTPKNLAARLNATPEAQLVTWGSFYPANRSWLTTVELSPEQAAGKMPISTEAIDSLTKGGKLVVKTFKGNPISVPPPANAVTPNQIQTTSQP